MMKKYISAMLLVLLLFILDLSISLGEDSLHLFRNISFNISVGECKQLLKEEYGASLEEEPHYSGTNQEDYVLVEPEYWDVFGMRTRIDFSFIDNQLAYVSAFHSIEPTSTNVDAYLSDNLDQFFSLIGMVESNYGSIDDGKIDEVDPELKHWYYDYPMWKGIRDEEEIRRIFVELKDPMMTTIFCEIHDNVAVNIDRGCYDVKSDSPMWYCGIQLFYASDAQSLKNALGGTEPFLGRNGSYPGLSRTE